MKRKKLKHRDFPTLKILSCIIFILLLVFIGYLGYRYVAHKAVPQSTYPQDFSSGKEVLYYTSEGLFSYNGQTKDIKQLANFGQNLYGSPILSPDNTKILYYSGTSNKKAEEGGSYNLWMYDLLQKKQFKLASDILLYPGYIQTPVWAQDSQALFITIQTNGENKLYRLDLQGRKTQLGSNYSGNFYWPRVINEKYLAFDIIVPSFSGPSQLGIVNLTNKRAFTIEIPDNSYTSRMQGVENEKDKALFIGFVDYTYAPLIETEEGKKDSSEIIGFELLDLDKNEAKRIKLPNSVKTVSAYRMQTLISECGDYVLMGKVADVPKGGAPYNRGYKTFYSYNLKENTIKELKGGDDKTVPLNCGFNKKSHKGYLIDTTDPSILVAVKEIDLSNPESEMITDYSNLLPQDIQQSIQNKCLGVGFPISTSGAPADSFSKKDFVYVEISPLPYWNMQNGNQNCSLSKDSDMHLSGIYRISRSENKIDKISNMKTSGQNYQTFLIIPNSQ